MPPQSVVWEGVDMLVSGHGNHLKSKPEIPPPVLFQAFITRSHTQQRALNHFMTGTLR